MIDAETELVRAAVRAGLVVAVPIVAVAAISRGLEGGLTALVTVAFVVGVFALTGWSLRWAAGHGPTAIQAVALGGFFLRLVLYAALIVVLRPVEAIDDTVLAVSAAVALVAVLAYETRIVLTHREFWMVDTSVRPATATPVADRKEPV